MKTFLAKLALKIFKNEYRALVYDIKIRKRKAKIISYCLQEIVLKDDKWHDIDIKFWVKNNKKDVYIDNIKI